MLVVVNLGAALFHGLISLAVLLVAFALLNGFVHWTAIFAPLVLLTLTLGFGWILAALGVVVRDIGRFIGVLTSALMFLSPVFYP